MLTENFQISEHMQYELVKNTNFIIHKAHAAKKENVLKKTLIDLFSKSFRNN